ncbi:paraquat-inducible protein A [Crenobacter sp. SG2303]|uniref:Paraquat-inducible protein A n=1 Tax=Crenobacter oryzisoli TaxID=3056844 RepID=A0ABT7XK72_9NEIS|nr:paraquat-inducible protein A [Crenobacter sp. SG2303]MDN0074186.1 paraquat-inducible protein A [Crenobacter sp. SG2303]
MVESPPDHPLIACHDCDLVYQETALPPGGEARCTRCGALLYRDTPACVQHSLAYCSAALLVFLLVNTFPILELETQGIHRNATLFGTALTLYQENMAPVAALVALTTLLAPALELSILCYLLLLLNLKRRPPGFAELMRLLQLVRPWGMVEVFLIGVLVSLVKLAHMAHVLPGLGLWSFGALILLMAASAGAFEPHEIWRQYEQCPNR